MDRCLHGSPNLVRVIRFYRIAQDSATRDLMWARASPRAAAPQMMPRERDPRAHINTGDPSAHGLCSNKKTAGPTSCRALKVFQFNLAYLPRFTAFFSSAPEVNLATLRAAILMVAPVCGLRPLRAFLGETENVPKPIKRYPISLSQRRSDAVHGRVDSRGCLVLLMWQLAGNSVNEIGFIHLLSWQVSLVPSAHRGGTNEHSLSGETRRPLFSYREKRLSTVEIRAPCRF